MTDQNVYTIFKAEVPEGSVDQLMDVAAAMTEQTPTEPGSIAYEWSLSEDQRRLHVYERFVDSEAGLAHLETAGSHLPELQEIPTLVEIECYGPASDELREATAGFPVKFMRHFEGFHR